MGNLTELLTESILDPVQEKLSPEIWKNEKLKSSVKATIVKRLETWLRTKTGKKPKKLLLLGSITGFQYTDTSDIDVNFILDISDEKVKELAAEMYTEINGKNIPGTKHPINYYVSNTFKVDWKKKSVYDIYKDVWIHKLKEQPKEETVITNYRAVSEIARFFTSGLDLVLSEYYADVDAYETYEQAIKSIKDEKDKEELHTLIKIKLQEIIADIDGLFIAKHMIRALRIEAFETGESLEVHTVIDIRDRMDNSINNLVYKYIEKLGYFDKVLKILDEADAWNKKLQEV